MARPQHFKITFQSTTSIIIILKVTLYWLHVKYKYYHTSHAARLASNCLKPKEEDSPIL
jgi:hypothetical protein